MEDIWKQLRPWVREGKAFALATVVQVQRSSPRGVGASLAVSEDGSEFIGSVSAGCVEGDVIEAAVKTAADGRTRWREFGPEIGYPWEVSLSCGGKIRVRIDRFQDPSSASSATSEWVRAVSQALDGGQEGLLVLGEGNRLFLDGEGRLRGGAGEGRAALEETAKQRWADGEPTAEIEVAGERALFLRLAKRPRLVVVGAVHVATHLVGMAPAMGFETVVVDPRESYARPERFPVAPDRLVVAQPQAALRELKLGSGDFCVALTHDPKLDDPALLASLEADCGYVGALGSRRSHKARLERLKRLGAPPEKLSRICGPVGLDIGSRTPAEIAVSILAEMVACRNGKLATNGA